MKNVGYIDCEGIEFPAREREFLSLYLELTRAMDSLQRRRIIASIPPHSHFRCNLNFMLLATACGAIVFAVLSTADTGGRNDLDGREEASGKL